MRLVWKRQHIRDRRGVGRRPDGGGARHAQTHPDPGGGGGPRRVGRVRAAGRRPRRPARPRARRPRRQRPRRERAGRAAPPGAQRGARELQPSEYGTDHAARAGGRPEHRRRRGRGRAQPRSSGSATPRTARTCRSTTGSTPFEAETGCQVNRKTDDTSDEMVTADAHSGGAYDGVCASGDATAPADRRRRRGRRRPGQFPDFDDVAPFLQTPRTTSSTASTTACRTAGAATC